MPKKYIFITGTGKGIGKALAELYLEQKETQVCGISRSNDISHTQFHFKKFDLSKVNEVERLANQLFDLALMPDDEVVLFNNAGILGDIAHLGELNGQSLIDVFQINVTAVALLMNGFIRQFKNQAGKKVIINISSGAGKNPVDGWSAYCTSKAAVDMLSKVAAEEAHLDHSGIKVFACAPGVVDTHMQDTIRTADSKQFSNIQRFIDLKKQNQLSSTREVALKLRFLADNCDQFDQVLQDVRQFEL